MSDSQLNRRRFLQSAALGTSALLSWQNAGAAEAAGPLKIEEPFHGAVLNHRHGKQTTDGLSIRVAGSTSPGSRVTVNGVPSRCDGNRFEADVTLHEFETDLVAVSEGDAGRHEDRVRVVWDRHSVPRYRFSIDDNSFFLRDIAEKQYASLFDCFYLRMLKNLHEKYGVKFTVNIYYTTGDDFSLPDFPDRYKGEWRDNANWMKLAFHAYANEPARPYQDAPPEKLIADLDLVNEQILRFAGEEAYAPPTVIHWGMTRHSAFKPLYERGVRALSGYFRKMGGKWDVNYRWDDLHSEYMSRHDAWKDFESGIVFSRVDIVCNSVPVDQIIDTLAPQRQDPNTAEIVDLFTHEQYFWPFYSHYLPDHAKRLDVAIRWATEDGYKPVFLHEGFLGGKV